MKDREYYLQLISDRLDRKLTQSEESQPAAAQQSDPSLAEYEGRLLAQRDILRSLPAPTNTLSLSAFVVPTHQDSIVKKPRQMAGLSSMHMQKLRSRICYLSSTIFLEELKSPADRR
ncbi:MAG: hypothetical protein ABIE70_08285 [bacterium]